jgi:hypothetical protein
MKVTPIKQYLDPTFPTHSILDERPELLRLVPRRWQANPVVMTALTTAALLACGWKASAANKPTAKPQSIVAPVFSHGTGEAGFGGIGSSMPTVFIPEDEARRIISNEARIAGINFALDSLKLEGVTVPVTDRFAARRNDNPKTSLQPVSKERSLWIDGTDPKRNISFEYVSKDDFNKWERDYTTTTEVKDPVTGASSTKTTYFFCTVYDISTKDAAVRLQKELTEANPEGVYAVFYDPAITAKQIKPYTEVPPEKNKRLAVWKAMENQANKTAREDLRAQVRDFIKWLKAEGVI